MLAGAATKLILLYDPEEADHEAYAEARCLGDCDRCQAARPHFEALRAEARLERKKAEDTNAYPYAVTRTGLHRSQCPHITELMADLVDDSKRGGSHHLRAFAHDGEKSSGWAVFSTRLSTAQAGAWTAEHTGPRGGLRYLCKTCKPEHP